MKKYIIVGGDGKEYGPVSIQEVKEWVSSDRANGETRIKEEGAEEWSRLRDMEFFGEAAKPAGPPTNPSQASTPSAHNPQVTPPPTADQLIGELQGRLHTFSIGDCLSVGWRLTMDNFGLFILTLICMMLISVVAGFVPFGAIVVSGPLMGGVYFIYLRRLRGEPAEIGQLFVGFNESFLPLFLVYLFQVLAMFVVLIPMIITIVVALVTGVLEAGTTGVPILSLAIGVLGSLLSMLLMMALGAMLGFAIPLTMDRKMDAWEAFKATWIITKHCWGKCLGMSFTLMAVNLAGILVLCLGMLVTAPLSIAMLAVAYEQLFGRGVRR
ncbi:MAG: GYF domain-containing protein [Verrucomicrobiota bacterium]|nr:GYF domain-containing protein [Verrucomicrobiota bacterium]